MTIKADIINEEAFYQLYGLFSKYTWLNRSQKAVLELWNLCDQKEQQELLKILFERFTFISTDDLEDIAEHLFQHIASRGLDSSRTFLCAISDSKEVDGSVAGLQFIKNNFPATQGWKEKNFIPAITLIAHQTKSNDNIVLFDDFIGSGKTMISKINYLKESLKDNKVTPCSISVISYAAMKFGIDEIKSATKIEVYTPCVLKKGLTDFESVSDADSKILLMKEIESKLSVKFKRLRLQDHSLGYKGSEALFQIQGQNCPNNLFPIFWWPLLLDQTERNTLFKRAR